MPRYTRCPYYIDESRSSISCEDVCRSYDSADKKWEWMDMYCDSWDWMKCPYAADISEAYKRYEEGDEMALIEQEIKAQKKEIESLLRKLGRANKKLDKERAKNKDLEAQKRIYFEKWRKAQDQLNEYEKKIADQLGAMAGIYEQRLAEAKQRAVDIIESVLPKDEIQTKDKLQTFVADGIVFAKMDEPQTDCPWK